MADIINMGQAAVAAADGVGVLLGTLQGVLSTDVNATGGRNIREQKLAGGCAAGS